MPEKGTKLRNISLCRGICGHDMQGFAYRNIPNAIMQQHHGFRTQKPRGIKNMIRVFIHVISLSVTEQLFCFCGWQQIPLFGLHIVQKFEFARIQLPSQATHFVVQ
jgi:hypothetical protein